MAAIDLRSDTVSRTSRAMGGAMANAQLGDDVFGDDPTVNRLQAVAAERFGMEAGLFFPSGTQSNLAAVMAHCQRGEELIVGQEAHTYRYEAGGAAVLGSIQPQPLANRPDGTLDLGEVEAAIRPDASHYAITRLIALENTIGGKVLTREYLARAVALARRRNLSIHLDGARIFNASVKAGMPVRELCAGFDTVSVCLSKGLGTPAGTVLVRRSEVIDRARRIERLAQGCFRRRRWRVVRRHVARKRFEERRNQRDGRIVELSPELHGGHDSHRRIERVDRAVVEVGRGARDVSQHGDAEDV